MTKALGKDTDAGVLDMPGEYVTPKKPIRMGAPRRFLPINVAAGDSIRFTITEKLKGWLGRWTPAREHFRETIGFKKAMAIDTFIPLEVIDEFGLDVGVGCLCGQSKK